MSAIPVPQTNVKQAVPFFAVADMERSARFYREGLGFQMRWRWIDEGKLRWCWLDLGGASVMLQEYRQEAPGARTPATTVGEGVSIYFICEDAIALYREFKARGVEAKRPFVGNHMWVTQVVDPDGYKLFFESPTDAPEESEYAG